MLKMKMLLPLLLLFGSAAIAQNDSTTRKDTVITDEIKEGVLDNIPTVSLDENDLGDGGSQGVSSLLTAGRDPYYSAAQFNFSAVRFRIRGYENDLFSTYMNGIPMDNLDNGFTPYGLWGGLNDVMRNRDVSWGLKYNTFAFGDIGSNTNIDSRASKQRVQTSINYALANRNYSNRFMITHSTGLSKKGWAFTISGSRRWAGEGYVPGTYYNGWGYFGAVDKRIGQKHLLSFTAFGAPTENGRQGASVQEMIDLSGTNYYNPNWGYQNGKKRNASIGRSHQPVLILTHDFRVSNRTNITTAAGYSFGDRSVTALDWYNAADPRPDYYRYLPSYTGIWASTTDQAQAQQLYQLMKSDINYRQINWQNLYNVNRTSFATINDANGIAGNTVSGHRSRYIVEERVINTQRFNANTVINTSINDHIEISGGASYQIQKNHYFKRVDDLLGGDFYVNVNQFAERDFPVDNVANQFDMDKPNRILYTGDKFGYDYNINITKIAGWAQGVFKFNKVDFFLSGQVSQTEFYRQGNTRNGLFPTSSYGKGTVNSFFNYGGKGGITYKIDGRNYIYVNGAYMTRAPYFENVYISPRTRNAQQDKVTDETIYSGEAAYVLNAPKLKVRLGGYYTHFAGGMDMMSFYHDSYQNFVNYAINGIDKLHFGGEFGLEAKLTPSLTLNAAAAVGRYYYDSKQNAVITVDNSASVLGQQIIYMENFKVPSTPMEAYSLGLNYRSPKFWFVSLTGNYFDQSYLSMNPLRRTWDALQFSMNKPETYNVIFDQTKFDANYTVDFFGGYSWKLPRDFEINRKPTFLVFNLGVNNLLNKKDIVTGGYEQLRYDAQTAATDPVQVGKFPPKLFYAYGINFFASVTLRF
ncbi:MAG: TonB-dependent receptor [Chitinophagaceae bacterium]|nr:TonB-dependent receptor [Chitinophagaceae bacterium]